MADHSHECEHTHTICACVSEEQLHEFLTNDDIIYDATQIYDALSDFTRFQILGALLLGEKSVTELQELLSVSQSATSHQLRLLRDRGLVAAKRDVALFILLQMIMSLRLLVLALLTRHISTKTLEVFGCLVLQRAIDFLIDTVC